MSSLRMNWIRAAVLLPLLLILAGCPFSPEKGGPKVDPPPPSEYLPLTSISNVLFNLKKSWQERNDTEYLKLLDDAFEYLFAPEDVGGPHGIPEAWGKADETISIRNIFTGQPNKDGYRTEEIRLAFTAGPEQDNTQFPDWKLVVITEINLQVDTRHKDNGDQLIYEVIGDQAWFYFVQTDEVDSASGKRIWKIIRQEDRPRGLLAAKTIGDL